MLRGGETTSILVLRKLKKSKVELHVTFILKEGTIQWQPHCDVMLAPPGPSGDNTNAQRETPGLTG